MNNFRRRVITTSTDSGGDVLDVLFAKNDGSELALLKEEDWPDSGWIPIGIVVVPRSHNRYGDGTCGIMSIKYMRPDSPENGYYAYKAFDWGMMPTFSGYNWYYANYDVFSSDTLFQTADDIYIPAQYTTGYGTNQTFETKVYDNNNYIQWPYGGTPTDLTDTPSDTNSITIPSMDSVTGDAIADFNGIKNTCGIYVQSKNLSVWTDTTISTSSNVSTYTPFAAACAGRFKTVGTQSFIDVYGNETVNNHNYGTIQSTKPNTGYWYLPSLGELTYIPPTRAYVNNIISKLRTKYGNSVGGTTTGSLWSSTNTASLDTGNYIWAVGTVDSSNAGAGHISKIGKSSNALYCRAFIRY